MESLLKPGIEADSLAGIPCYFDQFPRVRARWALEAFQLLWHIESFAGDSKRQAEEPRLRRLTRDRLKANARVNLEHLGIMKRLLAPLGADGVQANDYFNYFSGSGSTSSDLATFYPNLLRDWSWETDENEQCFELLQSVLPGDRPLGKVLVPGAGACRLPYDLHVRCKPELTLATDINPLLLICAKRVISGETLELVDLPYNPLNSESFGVKRALRAPAPVREGFLFALSDATRSSFAPGSFDTVLTPWLIDILPMDIHAFFPIINQLLKPGGTWLNFGPLLFRAPFARRYGVEEVIAIAEKSGFEIEVRERKSLPYLHSPGSSSHRTESVLAFRARKTEEVEAIEAPPAEAPRGEPAWLGDPAQSISLEGDLRPLIAAQNAFADVLSLVDGKRGLGEIASVISSKFGIPTEQALVFAERSLRGLIGGIQSSPMRSSRE